MCDYSTKLLAWLDRELEPKQMAAVQQHLPNCPECRASLSKYKLVSQALDDYCHAMIIASQPDRTHRRWVPVLSAAAAVLVVAATAVVFWHSRVQPRNAVRILAAPATAVHAASAEAPKLRPAMGAVRKSPGAHRMNSRSAPQPINWVPLQPALEVAIPADSMFPPGAVPVGVNFIADVSFAPDGSARQMRLRPRLSAVERSASQP